MGKVYFFKEIIKFVLLINILILLKNIFVQGIDNIYYYYLKNIIEILEQLLVSVIFGILIAARKYKKTRIKN